jgi:hypothetical protein
MDGRHTDDLFLLHCERESLQTWILCFEDSRIEAVVVLSDAMLFGWYAVEFHDAPTYEVNDHSILLSRRYLSRFHLSLMVLVLNPLENGDIDVEECVEDLTGSLRVNRKSFTRTSARPFWEQRKIWRLGFLASHPRSSFK